MSTKNINTTKSMTEAGALTDAELKRITKAAEVAFGKQKQVEISVPIGLQKALGTEFYVGVNGVGVVIPVDGKTYKIPEVLAKHAQRMINRLTT